MQHNQAFFESLFNRNFSDTGNTEFLQQLAQKHPYFSPAQFFLLEKTQGSTSFEQQAVKTNIFFNNPHWLYFQLNETSFAEEQPVTEEPAILHEAAITKVEPLEIEIPEIDIPQAENTPVENAEIDNVEEKTVEVEPIAIETTPITEAAFDDEPDNTDEPAIMKQETEPMHIKLKMHEENLNLDETMLFEPMHLVDYFASQGIKLSDEVQMGDKLGKQLKSFTEWLKTMKKVHIENEIENQAKTDTTVQILAEKSNTKAEVLTEAMAEVFASQGKMAKAEEVYQKLSLLNPAKSTYFAAKLQNLKGL